MEMYKDSVKQTWCSSKGEIERIKRNNDIKRMYGVGE